MSKPNRMIGYRIWLNDQGRTHREEGPAIEWDDGSKEWWEHGKRHRENEPAIKWPGYEGFWSGGVFVSGRTEPPLDFGMLG